ncbi:MAG: glycine cleavage system aminomethyltransferase GcvT [Planctomycetota bacterium]|nr:glycine cleavage system aminomethyltransferase GcvT [Planctomycetota bacterium]
MSIRKTPLHAAHAAAGARFVDFHGWEMPVQYEGILAETRRVRAHGGLFDLCHMGRLVITGPDREALVERVFSGNFSKLRHGRAKYGFLLNEDGYPIDDVLVYRDHEVVHIVINATGREADTAWVKEQCRAGGFDATVENVSDAQAMIALQGRASEHVLQPVCSADLSALRYYGFANALVCGHEALLARTGYTGEDGFELFFEEAHAMEVWNALAESGAALDVAPIGLGSRDLLRLEAGMPLYGQELNLEIDPLEAGLAFGVDLTKDDTLGVPALRARKEAGVKRTAISLAQDGGRVPRTGCPVLQDGVRVGIVTSGGVSPTVERNIARALVDASCATEPGAAFDIEIRGKPHPMAAVAHPFYKRAR